MTDNAEKARTLTYPEDHEIAVAALDAAADFLSDPDRFVRANFYADANGKPVHAVGYGMWPRPATYANPAKCCGLGALALSLVNLGCDDKIGTRIYLNLTGAVHRGMNAVAAADPCGIHYVSIPTLNDVDPNGREKVVGLYRALAKQLRDEQEAA